MKILVVDDEQSFGALLGHTLKRLGHKAVIAVNPHDALEMLDSEVEAVITDIDMPGMDGVQLAHAVRERDGDMPIAFCTGSAPDSSRVEIARRIGDVLPKIWTVADVKAVVEQLSRARRAATSATTPPSAQVAARRAPSPSPSPVPEITTPHPKLARPRRVRKLKIELARWEQVQRLCAASGRGPVFLTVRGPDDMKIGAPVAVGLALPDEITVAIAGEVQAVRPVGARCEIVIELVGLTRELAERLRSLAKPALRASSTSYSHTPARDLRRGPSVVDESADTGERRRLARGSDRELRVSELILGNNRLRQQIEGLPGRMRPKTRQETDTSEDDT